VEAVTQILVFSNAAAAQALTGFTAERILLALFLSHSNSH
jgi:hypothetical protein